MRLTSTPGVVVGLGFVLSFSGWQATTTAVRAAAPPLAVAASTNTAIPDPLPGAGLRTAAVRRYRMDGRIRPLLFWFGQEDIGMARITWRTADDGGRAYEMLVGTDPSKAPRAMNKWGFISEQVNGADGRLLALMTGNETTSYNEAADDVSHAASSGDFRAIVASVTGGASAWKTARISTDHAFSIHDVDSALDRIRQDAAAAAARQQPAPTGARPGFLIALAELIERGAGQSPDSTASRALRQQRVPFVFGQDTYELSLRDAARTTLTLDGRPQPVVRSSFEITTLATKSHTRFDVMFSTDDGQAKVPVAAEWQPRWWLKVELRLAASEES